MAQTNNDENTYYNTGPSRDESAHDLSESADREVEQMRERTRYSSQTETEQLEEEALSSAEGGATSEEQIREQYGFFGGEEASLKGRAARFIKGRKKTLIGVVLTVLFGVGGLGGFLFFSKSFQLAHIMANLIPANFGIINDAEGSRATKMLQRMSGCSRSGGSGFKQCTGNALTDKVNDWRLDRLETRLAEDGISFNYDDPNSPRMTSIDTPDGRTIEVPRNTTPFGFKKIIKPIITDNVRLGRRIQMRQLVTTRAGFDWRFYASRKVKDGYQWARNKMRGVETDQDGARIRGTEEQEDDSKSTKDSKQAVQEGSRAANETIADVRGSAGAGGSGNIDNSALQGARKFANANKGGIIVTSVMLGCIAEKYAGSLDDFGKKFYQKSLNYFGRAVTADHEQRAPHDSGKEVTAAQVGGAISVFHDNERGDHFDQSAAWKRATGEEPTGNEKDVGLEYGEEGQVSGASRFVQIIGGAIGKAGIVADGLCNFVTNGVVQYVADGAEVIAGFFSAGTINAIKVAFKEFAADVVLSKVIAQLSFPSAIFSENPQKALATLDMSMNLANVEYARSIGAPPASNAQVAKMKTELNQSLAAQDRSRGLVWRYFSPNNNRSFISRAYSRTIGQQPRTYLAKLLDIPNTVKNTVTTALSPIKSSAFAREPFDNYGIQQFAFTDQDLEIDPPENAREIHGKLSCRQSGGGYQNDYGEPCSDQDIRDKAKIELYQECFELPYYELGIGEGADYKRGRDEHTIRKTADNGQRVEVDCLERTQLYAKAGIYAIDNHAAANVRCQSHNKPCEEQEAAGAADTSAGNGQLQYPPNLTRGGCPDPYYKMPESKDKKYVIYARSSRRCGQKKLIGVLYTTAQRYYEKYGSGSKVYIGDLNGGAPHTSHKWGIAADLLAATNPRAADHEKGNYSTQATVDLGKILIDTGLIKNIWWCEPGDGSTSTIRNYAEQQGTPVNIKCEPGHDDHFHIDVDLPRGPTHAP